MTKQEKRGILVLIIVVIILGLVILISVNKKRDEAGKNEKNQNEVNKEEYVQVLNDGTRLNTSTKLQETKKIEGLEITDIQLTAKNNTAQLLGTITNTSNNTQGGFLADIKVIDKQGNQLTKAQVLIPEIKTGESKKLIASATFDYANAYDIIISRVK